MGKDTRGHATALAVQHVAGRVHSKLPTQTPTIQEQTGCIHTKLRAQTPTHHPTKYTPGHICKRCRMAGFTTGRFQLPVQWLCLLSRLTPAPSAVAVSTVAVNSSSQYS